MKKHESVAVACQDFDKAFREYATSKYWMAVMFRPEGDTVRCYLTTWKFPDDKLPDAVAAMVRGLHPTVMDRRPEALPDSPLPRIFGGGFTHIKMGTVDQVTETPTFRIPDDKHEEEPSQSTPSGGGSSMRSEDVKEDPPSVEEDDSGEVLP